VTASTTSPWVGFSQVAPHGVTSGAAFETALSEAVPIDSVFFHVVDAHCRFLCLRRRILNPVVGVPLMAPAVATPVPPILLTTRQAAAYLAISAGHLKNLTDDDVIPHVKLNRSVRYRRCDLDAAVEKLVVRTSKK
jgi:excisionase family DNA binding protein